MLGLMLKDLYYLKRQFIIYLLLLAFYVFIGIKDGHSEIFSFFVIFISFLLPITIFGFDEKTNWERYALALPLSRKDLVISKYIFVILFCLLFSVFNFIFQIVIENNQTINQSIEITLFVFSVAIAFACVIIPPIVKFGVERGRIVLMIVVLIPVIIVTQFENIGLSMPNKEVIDTIVHVMPFISIILLLFSITLSITIYNKKEL